MFTNPKILKVKNLRVGLKIRLNDRWWEITHLKRNDTETYLEIQSKFLGSTKITLKNDIEIEADKANTLGHKHQHVTYNESSQSKKSSKKIYPTINPKHGMGSF